MEDMKLKQRDIFINKIEELIFKDNISEVLKVRVLAQMIERYRQVEIKNVMPHYSNKGIFTEQ